LIFIILYGWLAGTSFSALTLVEIKKSLHPFDLQKNQGDFRGMSSGILAGCATYLVILQQIIVGAGLALPKEGVASIAPTAENEKSHHLCRTPILAVRNFLPFALDGAI